ncbi:FAD-dependent oxidoreductase [Salinibacterium soli]|uniref:FAD-dependent oxidoreductase n=1 Tax=Antiquaquibacter soli TaxID=3064523 RepID=A0ABT9BPT9_9MICO|nr:FAD-dependent oxidoreductase [Protaetiibacter sp. WY-16]MDO7882609.1 FAD-dependent oxidoreductase [Protaetiibacter sp. WY-16]
MTSLWLDRAPGIPTDPFPDGGRFDAVVVGGGLTGMTTALLLARAGRSVAVLEARSVGAVTTGNSTAKLSLLQGTRLSALLGANGRIVLSAYVDSQRAAVEWLVEYLSDSGVEFDYRDAVTYAATPEEESSIRREYDTARLAGLPVVLDPRADLPFETFGAVVLARQVQFDPMEVLARLTADVRDAGGVVVEGVRARRVRAGDPVRVGTDAGELLADRVVLATGIPVLDRGLYFAKVEAQRSHVVAFEVPEQDRRESGMFLSAGQPARSIRWHRGLLLVGGDGHPTGRASSDADPYAEIETWTREHWPLARRTHAWSAQDYAAASHVPFVGPLPRGRGRVLLATGFEKWGMTGAVSAALTLAADLGAADRTDWMRVLRHRITLPQALARGIGANARVLTWYARSWASALARTNALPEGMLRARGILPAVVDPAAPDDCPMSLVCPHLGAVVRWNGAERSWDCPAHGSRFSADGALLEGPARRGLRSVEGVPAERKVSDAFVAPG